MKSRLIALAAAAITASGVVIGGQERPDGPGFTFRTAVDLINVTATVTDENGRFVPNLKADDFVIAEDGKTRPIEQFDVERVPVSLGIALDTSGSMLGDKMEAALDALHRFLFELLDSDDEVFLYRFDSKPSLVHGWTDDRELVARTLGSVKAFGGTAIYDTVAEAVPLAQSGTRKKKALVIISDGNDTNSRTKASDVVSLIRRTEVLVYAIGIDASGERRKPVVAGPRVLPMPSPFPGKERPPIVVQGSASSSGNNERLNESILRSLTDDTGGRTEIIFSERDLAPATASVAAELNQQYFLAYNSAVPKDGGWHTIDVQLKRPGTYTVRARRGFTAN